MLERLKEEVYNSNMLLQKYGLALFTWGNVSGIDRESGLFVIKPSGVEYGKLTPEMMVAVNLDGEPVEDGLKPSSDTPTHATLYRAFSGIGGVAHTHSTWATSIAQTGIGIPVYGTTHGDYFYGDIPCTRDMTEQEILGAYEKETGNVIIETFLSRGINPYQVQAVLVKSHAPFTWGKDCCEAVENAIVLEEISKMAVMAKLYNTELRPVPSVLIDRHFFRKHGKDAYYGQG